MRSEIMGQSNGFILHVEGRHLSHVIETNLFGIFLLAQFSLYVHKSGLMPDSFHFLYVTAFYYVWLTKSSHRSICHSSTAEVCSVFRTVRLKSGNGNTAAIQFAMQFYFLASSFASRWPLVPSNQFGI